jgi:hypothetical protein
VRAGQTSFPRLVFDEVRGMPISVSCAGCGQAYKVPDTAAGKSMKCKKCGASVKIPRTSAVSIQSAPPDANPALNFGADSAPVPTKRRSNKLYLAVLGVMFVFFGCCLLPGGGVLGYYYFFKKEAPDISGWTAPDTLQIVGLGDQDSDPLRYLPDDSAVVWSLRVNDLMKSPLYARLKKEVPDGDKQLAKANDFVSDYLALSIDDIDRVVTVIDPKRPHTVVVGRKPFDIAKMVEHAEKQQKTKFKEMKVGKYSVYQQDDMGKREFPLGLCVPEPNILLVASPSVLRTILPRGARPALTDTMQAAVKRADWKQPFVLVGDAQTLKARFPQELEGAHRTNATYKIESLILTIRMKSDEVRADAVLVCGDEPSADKLQKAADGFVALMLAGMDESVPKEVKDAFQAVQVSAKGKEVQAEMAVKHSVISSALQQVLKPPAAAVAEPPPPKPNEGPVPKGWVVLFRSADPSVWNTDSKQAASYARPVEEAHSQIRYLRLKRMDTGEALIVRITSDKLLEDTRPDPARGFWWHGVPGKRWGAHHLGVVQIPPKPDDDRNAISVTNDDFVAYYGSGFGHKYGVNDRQCYSWLGKEIPKTMFEIAVKCGPLTEAEKRLLK